MYRDRAGFFSRNLEAEEKKTQVMDYIKKDATLDRLL